MKQIEVRVPHDLGREEMRRRLDSAVVRAREQYADSVGPIHAEWSGDDRMLVNVEVMGMRFDGTIEVQVGELVVLLQLPGMASLFAGRIQEGIQERLGGLIGSQQA